MTDRQPDVATLLEDNRAVLLSAARTSVERAQLTHYPRDRADVIEQRLDALLDVVVTACRTRRLDEAVAYAAALAAERHSDGFPLAQVQTVINVLEEAIWRLVVAEFAPEDRALALGLVATVLGSVKDHVACKYLEQLGQRPGPTFRVDLLFAGSEGHLVP